VKNARGQRLAIAVHYPDPRAFVSVGAEQGMAVRQPLRRLHVVEAFNRPRLAAVGQVVLGASSGVTDQNSVAGHDLQVTRCRTGDFHGPVARRIALVHVDQPVGLPVVHAQEPVFGWLARGIILFPRLRFVRFRRSSHQGQCQRDEHGD
jgi:hypothetical protein